MKEIHRFADWIRSQANRLRFAEDACDQIYDRLLRVDRRLGVEVSEAAGSSVEPREVIFTAFSDPDAFPLVRDLVDSIGPVRGWSWVALKPERGFSFTLTLGVNKVRARDLLFTQTPGVIGGISIISPQDATDEEKAEETAWLVVETGIGEELAGRIQHLEFTANKIPAPTYEISKLAEYVRNNLAAR